MRFSILVSASFFVTLAVGLVIPHNTLSSRDLEVRDGLVEDTADILVREPTWWKPSFLNFRYHVPAGGLGKPAQTYLRHDVNKAVQDATTEHKRLATASKTQKRKSDLKTFNNNNHHVPKSLGFKKAFPFMKGKALEYPLPNKSGNPGKGPARVIIQELNKTLKFKGVVAHDQSRAHGTPGANDHFRVLPSIRNPFKKP